MQADLGMVLSGGGVRGLAHVGVLQALSEEGIEPDILSGASAGAIVAALYAAGHSTEEMLRFFVDKSPFRVSRLALAKPGIFDSEKIVADFEEYFPEDSFEALDKPIFITATELVEGTSEVFSSGELIRPILASASAPLVFTPTEIDGNWYSDGGITDNFPVEVLEGRCAAILGVYVNPLPRVEEEDLRSVFTVSQRALEIGIYQTSRRKFERCDVLLSPGELSEYGAFDARHLEKILEIGYRAARERMDDIRGLLA